MKYKKKPVEIEAVRITEELFAEMVAGEPLESWPAWLHEAFSRVANGVYYSTAAGSVKIETLEGTMTASPGDWIIRGVQGELYPCKDNIFQATYDKVE